MRSPTVQTQWSAAARHGERDRVLSPKREQGGPSTAHDAKDTDQNQLTSAAIPVTSAIQPSQLSLKEPSRHRSTSALPHLESIQRNDELGGTHTRRPTPSAPAVAAATTAIQPPLSSVASVHHSAASVSSKARQGCSPSFTRPSSAAANFRGTTNGSSVPHPALRSRSISTVQQQQLQHLRTLPRHASSARSSSSHSRPASAEPRKDFPQMMTSGSAAARSQESATSVPSGNARRLFVKNPMTAPPVATTAHMRAFSNKALYVRPRSASLTCISLPDPDSPQSNRNLIQVLAVSHNSSPAARAWRAGIASNSAIRGPESLSQSNQRHFLPGPRTCDVPAMDTREQFAVDGTSVKAAQRSRSCSASMVQRQQPQQTTAGSSPRAGQTHPQGTLADAASSGTPGRQLDESGAADNDGGRHRFVDKHQASEKLAMAVPFTPQAAAGVAGIEIGPAAGEWNLPRIQQRILAARLQAEVHQHFTSAVEILLAVQISLDVDYQEASQGGGGREPASVFLLTPAQRAYYADLVGRELQYVTSLWTAKLQFMEPPTVAATTPAVNRLRGTARNIAGSYAVSSDPTTATEAAGAEGKGVRLSNDKPSRRHSRATARLMSSSGHCLSPPTHATNSTASSTSRPDSATPAHSAVAVSVTSTDHPLPKIASRKRAPVEFHEIPEMQRCAHRSRQLRDSATDDVNGDGSEASQLSSILVDTSNSKMVPSSPLTSAFSEGGISATGIRTSEPSLRAVPESSALNGTTAPSQPFRQRPPCDQRRSRQPIRRSAYLMDAISTDSSAANELSSVWDDEVLGSQLHGPFEDAAIQRVRCRSMQRKRPSINEPRTPIEARSSSHSSRLGLTAEGSDGRRTGPRGSLVAETSPEHSSDSSGRWVSVLRACPPVCQLSPSQLAALAAKCHAAGGAVASAPTLERETAPTALHKAEDAASSVSAHAGSSHRLSLTASPVVSNCSPLHTPKKHRPAHSAVTDVDAAAPPSCRPTELGKSTQSPLGSSSPIASDAHAGDSAPAPFTLSAAATSGEAAAKTQPVGAGDANIAPASRVSSSTPLPYMKDGEQYSELNGSGASSAVKRRQMVQQSALLAEKQRRGSASFSVIEAPGDTQLSSGTHTSSTHPLPRHRSSGGDDRISSSGVIRAITITIDSTSGAEDSSATTTEKASITATASSAGAQHGHHHMQHPQSGTLDRDHDHQESQRLLSPPSSTPMLAARDESGSRCPSLSPTQTPYAYEHKTIVCSDGQPCKRLILCKAERPPRSTRLHHTEAGFVVPSNSSQRGVSGPATPRSLSPPSNLTPTHSQHTASTPVIVGADGSSPRGAQTELQHQGRPDTMSTVTAHKPHTSLVATSASLAAGRLEGHRPLAMLATHSAETSPLQREAGMADDERAVPVRVVVESVAMGNPSSADSERQGVLFTVSPAGESVSQDDFSGTFIREAVAGGGRDASTSGAVETPGPGRQTADGSRVSDERRQFIFSGDVAQLWLDEEGSFAGTYCNTYRVPLQRVEAAALKWRGPPVCNLRALVAVGDGDVACERHSAHSGRSVLSSAAAEVSATVSTETLHEARCVGGMPGGVTRTCTGPTDIHFAGPRELLKTRRWERQHNQLPQPKMLRQSTYHLPTSHGAVTAAAATENRDRSCRAGITDALPFRRGSVKAETVRGDRARVCSTFMHFSLPPDPVTQLLHRKVYSDDNFVMFRRAAVAAVAASRPVMAEATQQKRPESAGAARTHPWHASAQ
ncbi:hypothetical protein, unknown function [Leishmania mexicana MHOM/GT/2001/U1103]|uniref:Uncharacterized protein n=1 Tax=Leishmania mexicana (strain MHOM/GT/2001/U1103) TaxID=929439 RepID=E9AY92_LEIMU|nr:hypothetical protein, unknown function [Leishmania mexicana MHOM/GT/2001/U1103]CBZ27933.1 hypothetical protein, unknown function [Leishmania mexicana MHOM/GT/2001/U1103]